MAYACKYCGRQTRSIDGMLQHLDKMHPEIYSEMWRAHARDV